MTEDTDSNSVANVQSEIRRLIANNPKMTDSEIAAETGTHIPLVKSIRSKHDGTNQDISDSDTDSSSVNRDTDSTTVTTDTETSSVNIDTDGASVSPDTDGASATTDTESTSATTDTDSTSATTDTETSSVNIDTDGASATADTDSTSATTDTDSTTVTTDTDSTTVTTDTDSTTVTTDTDSTSATTDTDSTSATTDTDSSSIGRDASEIIKEADKETTEDDAETEDDDDVGIETQVLELVSDNPDLTNAAIAEKLDTHAALVRDIRAEHSDDHEESTADSETADSDASEPAKEAETGEQSPDTRTAVRKRIEENPDQTNADIAAEVGTNVSLVRDIRNELNADDEESGESTTPDAGTGDTDTETAVLELAADNPDLTNAEIADEVGTHVAIVRDIRADHSNEDESASDEGSERGDEPAIQESEIDTTGLSETQLKILEMASKRPQMTNAEIAQEVGTHVATVRDLRNEYDDVSVSVSETSESDTDPEPVSEDSETSEPDTTSDTSSDSVFDESVIENTSVDTTADSSSASDHGDGVEAEPTEEASSDTGDSEPAATDVGDSVGTEPVAEPDTTQPLLSDLQIVFVVFGALLALGFVAALL
jgi:DNA-binding CsgD family transcriptional regulator